MAFSPTARRTLVTARTIGLAAQTLLRPIALVSLYALLGIIVLFYTLRAYATIVHAPHTDALWDFKLFYSGVLDFFTGGSRYKPSAALPCPRTSTSPNNNSPVGSLIFLPLSRLPLPLAAALWEGGSLILLLLAITYIWREVAPPRQWRWRIVLLAGIYVSFPVVDALSLGTWGMLIAFLDVLAWYYIRKGAQRRAGILLGVALVLRWQPLTLLLYMIMQRRWRVVTSTFMTAAICCGLAFLVFGLRSFIEFASLVLRSSHGVSGDPYDGSLCAELIRLVHAVAPDDPHLASIVSQIGLLGALCLLGVTLWRCWVVSFDQGFSLCITCGLLITPMSWTHYHMALLLPLAIVAQQRRWPVLCVGIIWLSNTLLPFHLDAHPFWYGTAATASLLVVYGSLWIKRQSPRPTSNAGQC